MERSIGLDFLFTITFFAPKLDIVGDTPHGKRIIANVDGGHFEGPNIKGTVQPPASDCFLSGQIILCSWMCGYQWSQMITL